MAEEFLSDNAGSVPPGLDEVARLQRDREPVQLILIGSRYGIGNVMKNLYQRGFAQMHEWSKPIPDPSTGRLMTTLIKYISPE